MVFEPRFRMGPPPRSFAADAHDCIMVTVLTDRPNTSLWREVAPDSELPSVTSSIANTDIATQGVPTPQPSLPRSNKSAAVLATVKGKSLRDGLRPPLTVAALSSERKSWIGTRGWSPPDRTEIIKDEHLTPIAPYKCFGTSRLFHSLPK